MSSGVLAACFSAERLAARLPPPGSWHPYPAIPDRAAWEAVHPATRDHVLAQAARLLASPWPVLTASDYARFHRDGDRQTYERPYFARRSRLAAAVLTAALAGPAPERIADILDGVWLLSEETSWCLPSADLFARQDGAALPDPARPCVDLFAAETAALLACTDLLAGDLIDAVAPVARSRLRDEVQARVLGPYRDSDHWWWLGLRKKDLNNWTPWIHSSLLLASVLLDTRPEDIARTAGRAVAALDRYLDAVPDDGGCDEGIGYWWRAGGSLFECLETLASACDHRERIVMPCLQPGPLNTVYPGQHGRPRGFSVPAHLEAPGVQAAARAGRPRQDSRCLLAFVHHGDPAVGRVVAEHEVEDVFGSGCLGGAREHGLLVLAQRGLDVAGVGGDGLAKLGSVQHGQVRAFAVGWREVGGVAEQGHPGHPGPAVPGRERVEGAHDRCGVPVGDQRGEFGCPPAKFGRDPRRYRCAIGAREPVRRLLELGVGMHSAAPFPVSQEAPAWGEREHRPGADRLRRGAVTGVGVEQEGLDGGEADVPRGDAGQQRADP